MRLTAVAVVLAAIVIAAASYAAPAPKPSEVPVSWQLEIDFHKPQAIRIRLAGEDKPRLFWYLRYTVTNRTGADRIFVPEFVLYTDTGEVLRAGQKTPTAVFEYVKKLRNDPLLKDMAGMTGKLLQGEDNAKSSVAIWPDFDPAAGEFEIFIGGLSGETAEILLPKPIRVTEMDYTGKKRTVVKDKVVLTKALQLRYGIPGEAAARVNTAPRLITKAWVMR